MAGQGQTQQHATPVVTPGPSAPNRFDDITAEMAGQQTASQNLAIAAQSDPTQQAKALHLSRAIGVPQPAVATDIPGYTAQAQQQQNQQLVADRPGLQKVFANNQMAAQVGHDDVKNLADTHDAFQNQSLSSWTPSVGEKIRGWIDNLFSLPDIQNAQAQNAYAEKQEGLQPGQGRGVMGGIDETPGQILSKGANAVTFGMIPDVAGEANTTAGQIGAAGGQLGGFLLGPMKAADAILGKLGIGALESEAGDSFIKALGKNVVSGAASLALGSALQNTGTALGSDTLGQASRSEFQAAKGGAEMGATFGAVGRVLPDSTISQWLARAVTASAAIDAEQGKMPFQDLANWNSLSSVEKVSSLVNYGMNLVFTAKGMGRSDGGWVKDDPAMKAAQEAATQDVLNGSLADKAITDQQRIETLSKLATDSKIRNDRDQETYRNVISTLAENSDMKDLYVDANVFAQGMDKTGVSFDDLKERMPAVADQLNDAIQTNGTVKIPMEDYLTHVAGAPLEQQISQHLQTDPEGMTFTEGQQFYQDQVKIMQDQAAKISDAKAADVEYQKQSKAVRDDVKQQLMDTGRFTGPIADQYAQMHQAFFSVLGDRLGMTPDEAYKQYGAKVVGEPLTGGYFGQEEGTRRAAYDPETATISLLKDADLSSFVHESGHFFLDTYSKLAGDSPEIGADMDTLLDHFGVKDLDTWHGMSIDEQRPYHEQLARDFEKYLYEGKAPTPELQPLFSRIRSWMISVYKSIIGDGEKVNPEVAAVFDRMLASQDQIEQAEKIRGYEPIPKPEGMSDADFADYLKQGDQATQDAISEMNEKSLKDLKWAMDAKERHIRNAQISEETPKIKAEIARQPIEQVRRFLTKGEIEGDGGNVEKMETGFKLNRDDVARIMGDKDTSRLTFMMNKDGMHPDSVAEMFGFGSGKEMMQQLLDEPKTSVKVKEAVDQRMQGLSGKVAPEELQRAAEDAIHNEARAKQMATGLKMLSKSPVPVNMLVKAAKEAAGRVIAETKVGDLSAAQYRAAEARANKDVIRLAPRDTEGAIQAQRAALLNNRLVREATDAITEMSKAVKFIKRFDKTAVREKLPGDFLEQIDAIRNQFDLRDTPQQSPTRAEKNLVEWARSQQEAGYFPHIDDWLSSFGGQQHYKDLTVEQLRGITDTIKSIEYTAKQQRTAIMNGKEMEVNDIARELIQRMNERGEKFTKEDLLEPPTVHLDGFWKTLTHWMGVKMRLINSDLTPQEFKFNKYDLHEIDGPFRQALLDRILDGNYGKVDMIKEFSDKMMEVGDKLGKDWQKGLADLVPNSVLLDPDLSFTDGREEVPVKLTRGKMLAIARHVGNESNFMKLVKGWGWRPDDVWNFLHENMTEKDWMATQAHWDSFEPLWKETEAMIRRLGGVPPPKIPAREFETKFGKMKGGYSPIDYDPLRSKLSVSKGEFDLEPGEKVAPQQVYRATTTSNGSLISRAEGYTDRVSLDFRSADARVRDTIHDLAYREPLMDATKIINHAGFREKFQQTFGREEYQALTTWLKDIRDMNSSDPRDRGFVKAMNYARQGVVLTGIAYRLSTVMKHGTSAALKSLGYLGNGEGAAYFAARLARMGTGHLTEDIQGAKEKFDEIRTRMLQMDRDYKEGNRSMYEAEGWRQKNDRFGHAMVAWSDALSAVPTSWAAYDLAKTSGVPESMGGTGQPMSEEEAIRYANSMVRQAHGSALEVTRSNFMQSRGWKNLFGVIYGFMNNTYGQMGDMLDKAVVGGHFSSKPAIAARAMATLIIPALITQWIKDSGPKQDENPMFWAAKAIGGELAATVPFVRDASSMLEYGHSDQSVAPYRLIGDAYKAGTDVKKELEGNHGKIIQDMGNLIGEWAHIGGLGQAGKTLQYLKDVNDGYQNPANLGEMVQGATIGIHKEH